jgi:hypothetical protein
MMYMKSFLGSFFIESGSVVYFFEREGDAWGRRIRGRREYGEWGVLGGCQHRVDR